MAVALAPEPFSDSCSLSSTALDSSPNVLHESASLEPGALAAPAASQAALAAEETQRCIQSMSLATRESLRDLRAAAGVQEPSASVDDSSTDRV